ncbi:MAG: radical SAM protein [Planctomycetes bacterium]|nr:radical SAM protein [Planctomycetota bacterium]
MMIRKGLAQLRQGVKTPEQLARTMASEAKMRMGLPTLRSLELASTWVCNLKCEFCYAEDLMSARQKPPAIAIETVRELLRQARALGLIHVNVTGGEPLTRKDIFELIDAVPKDVVVSIVTNSILLTEERVDRLKEAGVSTIQMSYGENYDRHFKLDIARHAVRRGLSVTLSVVNIRKERKWVLEALEMAPREGFSVLFNYPMRYKNEGLDSEVYWQYRYEPYVREDNLFWSGKDRCPAGNTKIYVTNDGDVMTCDRIHGSFGNIHTEPLEPIWRRMYERFKGMKTFCLLETCPKQWAENNRRAGKDYDVQHMGTDKDPFNVFIGTAVEKDLVPAQSSAAAGAAGAAGAAARK